MKLITFGLKLTGPSSKLSKKVLIKDSEIIFVYDYAISNPAYIKYQNKEGFSKYDLFECIINGYIKLYNNEIEGVKMFKGRTFEDLTLEYIEYDPKTKKCMIDISG